MGLALAKPIASGSELTMGFGGLLARQLNLKFNPARAW